MTGPPSMSRLFFFLNDPPPPEISPLSPPAPLPISDHRRLRGGARRDPAPGGRAVARVSRPRRLPARHHRRPAQPDRVPRRRPARSDARGEVRPDRKSTRLNSSHLVISYAVFCLKKK